MIDKIEILAMTSEDLRKLLEDSDMLDRLEEGKIMCPDTGAPISWGNLGTVRIENGKPVLYSVGADSALEQFRATG